MQTPAGLKLLFKLGLAGLYQPRASGRFTSPACPVYWEFIALLCCTRPSCSTASLLGFNGEHSGGLQDGAVWSVLALGSPPPLSSTPCTMKPQLHIKANPRGAPVPSSLSPPSPPMDPACRIQPLLPPLCPRRASPRWFHPPPSLAGCFSPPLLLPSSSKYAFRAIRRLFSLWNKCSLPGFEHRGGGGTHTDLMTVI